MKQNKKISFKEIVRRLGDAADYTYTIGDIAVLMHGWTKKHPEQAPGVAKLRVRRMRDGYGWLSPSELAHFSVYVGYDLTGK